MVIPRTVKVLFLFFVVVCGNGQLTFADNFNHRNEADRILTLTHLYQIETIDSLLQAIFKENPTDQGINPLQINFLLFQTGRKTLAIQNLQIHYNYLSNNALPSEIIQFLKLYSVLLEEMGQSENALSLWKELAKKNVSPGNDYTSTLIFTEIIRIYNHQKLDDKAALFEIALQNTSQENIDADVIFDAEVEKIKMLINKHDDSKALTKLSELSNLTNSNLPNYFYQMLDINVLAWMIAPESPDLKHWTEELKKTNIELLAPHKRSLANAFLGLYHTSFNEDSAYLYYQKAYADFDQFEKALIAFSNQKIEFVNHLSTENTDAPPPKQLNLKAIVIFGLLSCLLVLLFVWMLNNYLKYKKALINKIDLIEKNTSESQAHMQESFNNFDTLAQERAADLQKELTDRERIDRELQEALSNAEEANYQKNAFLSNISHEIRTPLNGIIGFSNLLENELAMLDQPLLFDYANSIQKSGEKLLHLLNNIIDISRLEANDINFQVVKCDLSMLLDEILQPLYPQAAKKGIRIVKEVAPLHVHADKEMLAKVLDEMLDNAMKYTDKGFIRIVVEKNEADDWVKISIRDTGIGIDKNYLPELFEAYRNVNHGYTRQYQGAALGIPLSKQLVEKMGGTFKLESQKGDGTTITIVLPHATPSSVAVNAITLDVNRPEGIQDILLGKRILLVEDDHASRKIITKYLDLFAEVVVAVDGNEALAAIQQHNENHQYFHLLLFDINLPAPWDGIKLLQHIKTNEPKYAKTPALAQTAYAMSGDKESLLKAGFNGYLSKPIQRLELYKEIMKVMVQN